MNNESLQQAQKLLDDLLTAARAGTIVPVRLPAQIEAVAEAIKAAQAPESPAPPTAAEPAKPESAPTTPADPAASAPSDQEQFLKDQAAFVSHAIHELRTPMTSIRGYSDMLANPSMGELTDMQKQFVETIRTNARRMEGLLTDVSDMAKIRGGTLRIAPKMDMFKNIAMMTEKATRPLAEQLKRTLTFDIPQGLPILNVDGEMLAKALTKLVENALRYNDKTPGEVTVRGAADGTKLVITIQDDGIGMTPEETAQLGTIYFRSENDLVRTYKGSGLGIPVAYGIIRLLGGAYTLQSQPGQGTTITVTLNGMS